MDEVLGADTPDEGDDFDNEPPADSGEPPADRSDGAEGDDSDDDDDSQESESSGPPSADEDDDDGDDDDDASSGIKITDEDDDEEDEDPVAKRERGMRKEIVELRRKLAQASAGVQKPPTPGPVQQMPAPAPAPPAPGRTTEAPQFRVMVSEDGSQVYVDPQAVSEYVRQEAARVVEASRQPTPQDIKVMENERATQEFVLVDPETNGPIAERAKQADDYLTLQLQNMLASGHQFSTVREAVDKMRLFGIDQQMDQYFPEISPMFDEFVEGMASGNPIWRRSILTRMRDAYAPSDPAPSKGPRPNIVPKAPPKVTEMPKSLTRKGGSRSQGQTSDEKEFNSLSDEFQKDFMLMPEEKWNRMQSLGKRLGKKGYEGG